MLKNRPGAKKISLKKLISIKAENMPKVDINLALHIYISISR